MEPVTHILTGACLGRTGLNRRAAYTTVTMAIAAELPDIDTVWGFRGPIEGFAHHRGITHTFLGIPFEAALIVGSVWLAHRWRERRHRRRLTEAPPDSEPHFDPTARHYDDRERIVRPLTVAPVRWGLLYLFALVALLSHLLLDFTNNYGVRPFFPFNPHWYAGSIVFIFDPLIFLLLVAALTLPWLFGLIGGEVGVRHEPFRASGWAVAALTVIVAYWGIRTSEHAKAVQMVRAQAVAVMPPELTGQADASASTAPAEATPSYLGARRALASPDPPRPFRWYTVGDYGNFYEIGTADTFHGELAANNVALSRPSSSPTLRAALATQLARVYLDWSAAPSIETDGPDPAGDTTVTFRDLRFAGSMPFLRRQGPPPLSGQVIVDRSGRVLDESLDGRSEPSR